MMKAISFQMESLEASYAMRRASILTFAVAFDGAQNDSILPLRNRFMSDPSPSVQIAAINAMGDIGDPIAVPDLVHIGLDHPESSIRAASAVALGKIEDPGRVIPALKEACNDESAKVRRQATDAISKHYGSDPELVYATLLTGLSDFDERVRESAAAALARVDDTRAIEPLLQATGDRTAVVRSAAARALGSLISTEREKEIYPVIALLADQNPGVQAAALDSLTRVTTKDFGGEQESWQKYFWEKYPELDPKNMYEGGPKPRFSSGISSSNSRRTTSSRRTTTPRNTGRRTTRNNRNVRGNDNRRR
jgi:vesicle coat complex subunit